LYVYIHPSRASGYLFTFSDQRFANFCLLSFTYSSVVAISPCNVYPDSHPPIESIPYYQITHFPIFLCLFIPFLFPRASGGWVVLKFHYISYVHFITLPCILLLSLCFGSTCTPLTLLQLRYILWCFIVCFGIIFGDLTCAFLSSVQDFMHLLCTIIGHNIHTTPL